MHPPTAASHCSVCALCVEMTGLKQEQLEKGDTAKSNLAN